MKTVQLHELPDDASRDVVYRLLPIPGSTSLYGERTDRNIGWITPEEQELLRNKVVGVAGCGGMGGTLAIILLRLGVGEIRIADIETFDHSNRNRQAAANLDSIGKSKAFETARMLRSIATDTTVVVYPMGIIEGSVDHFYSGCDLVCDEVEFWAVGARLLLHAALFRHGGQILNSPTVGHRTYLFNFTRHSMRMEEVLGMRVAEALHLQEKIGNGTATHQEQEQIMRVMLRFAAPEIPEYSERTIVYSTADALVARLITERKASIIATNPPMASGFLANHVLFALLKDSPIKRRFVYPPPMPGYLMIDAGLLTTKKFEGVWWSTETKR